MATRPPAGRPAGRLASLGQLWQVPLLAVALGLFGYAAYLFIDPKAGPTIDQKIDVARTLLKDERPEAAINVLNRIVVGEKLDRDHDGTVHLMLGQALAALQAQKHLSLRTYHEQIVEQTQLAESEASNRPTTSSGGWARAARPLASRPRPWTTTAGRRRWTRPTRCCCSGR